MKYSVDRILNQVTMYRLVLYFLIFLIVIAGLFGAIGWMPYGPVALGTSLLVVLLTCWAVDTLFAKVFHAPANVESTYISALILVLIITPPASLTDVPAFVLLFWASVWAMAAKFIVTIDKKHIFNPVAFAVALTAITLGLSATWWVGTAVMLPFVLAGGLLVVRKVQRFNLVTAFLATAFIAILAFSLLNGNDGMVMAYRALLYTSALFFATVMLTEPLTTPPTRSLQVMYGIIVGLLFAPQLHIGPIYFTPELALLCGNVFSYAASPKGRQILKLEQKVLIAPDTYDFIFQTDKKPAFRPGQYLELTLGHPNPDSRGNRRYFTIASSPTESGVRFGIKFHPDSSSSFKKWMQSMSPQDELVASQLAGDFVLPSDPQKKLVFIAGGIGITPFRSMLKYLSDRNEKRSVVLFYSNYHVSEIAYADVLNEARQKLGVKTVYTLTDPATVPADWTGRKGFITSEMIESEVPDYRDRTFYVSGPHAMVVSVEKTLASMGVPSHQIKPDFFPGFA